jgi:hypothetical protein
VEKVGMSNTGIVQYAISLRCFRKHKMKDPKGKEEGRWTKDPLEDTFSTRE